jgi:redox-sensing transcriptional repressor
MPTYNRGELPSTQFWGPSLTSAKRKSEITPSREVPHVVVSRLSLYLRELQHLIRDGRATVSSSQLGDRLGFTDAQVRKDLAYFGHFGHPGIGYRCHELVAQIRHILGTDRQWTVTMVGVGNMGRALLRYKSFAAQGFQIVAAFDVDPRITGLKIEGIPVYGQERMIEIVRQQRIQLGMITVPATQAQHVADELVAAGIVGIVNFAPVTLSLPAEVSLVGVDLTTELEQLAFSVANKRASC